MTHTSNFSRHLLYPLAAVALCALSSTAHAQALLTEDFSGTLNPARWTVVLSGIPLGGASVGTANGECELTNRGHLVSAQSFDYGQVGAYRVKCSWRWTDNYDRFQLLVRSDGLPGGSYGETQTGIELITGMEGGSNVDLAVRGTQLSLGPLTLSGPGVQFAPGVTYTAQLTDLGWGFRGRIEGPNGQWWELERAITSGTSTDHLLVAHNREATHGQHTCLIDDFVVEQWPLSSFLPFGQGCPGSNGIPQLTAATGSLPTIGQSFAMNITGVPITGFFVAVVPFLGFSNATTGGASLPRDLTPLGMPGCTQYVDPFQVSFLFTPTGAATWSVAIPAVAAFAGLETYVQAAVVDMPANALGLTATNAAAATLGW